MPVSEKTCAKDIMQSSLVTLRVDTRLEEAARTFADYKISGAPVLDETGGLVGVLSAADITQTDHPDGGRLAEERREYYLTSPLEEDDEFQWERDSFDSPDGFSPDLQNQDVGQYMSRDIVSVGESASLEEVARRMLEQRVHRVLVVEDGGLKGLISSMDLVRHIAGPSTV